MALPLLTLKWNAAISPEYSCDLANGATLLLRADWTFRDDMFGEPTFDPTRFTRIDSRDLLNLNVTYRPARGRLVADRIRPQRHR